MSHPTLLAWLDIETTGLDERTGHLLEVAIVITDNDFNEVAEPFSMLVQPTDPAWKDDLNDFVTAMHTDNGLIRDLDAGMGTPLPEVEFAAVHYLQTHCGTEAKPMMGGNSITFDRNWLKHHMPMLLAALFVPATHSWKPPAPIPPRRTTNHLTITKERASWHSSLA